MNRKSTDIKNLFSLAKQHRPASLIAAASMPVTSVFAMHAAAGMALPGEISSLLTGAMIGAEWLQWTAMGRLAAIEDANDDARAMAMKLQIGGLAAIQIAGYCFTTIMYAAHAHQDWTHGLALAGVIAFACVFAALNIWCKWTSCDPVAAKGRRTANGVAIGVALPALPAPTNDEPRPGAEAQNVYRLTLRDREIAGQADDRRGLRSIIQETEAARQADMARHGARRDPETGKWRKVETPKRRRKVA